MNLLLCWMWRNCTWRVLGTDRIVGSCGVVSLFAAVSQASFICRLNAELLLTGAEWAVHNLQLSRQDIIVKQRTGVCCGIFNVTRRHWLRLWLT